MKSLVPYLASKATAWGALLLLSTLMLSGSDGFDPIRQLATDHAATSNAGFRADLRSVGPEADAQDKMASDGRPTRTSAASIVLAPVLKPDNTDSRHKKLSETEGTTLLSPTKSNRARLILGSASLVASDLGRRLTLVGARPSGTG